MGTLRKVTSHFSSASALGHTSETEHELLAPRHPAAKRPLCVGRPRVRPIRPGSNVALLDRASRVFVPSGDSPLESGLPGASTPGIFRPWPFSDLRRFTPPDGLPVLFHTDTTYGIQRTRTIDVSCGPDRATLGTVPSGITSRTRTQPRRVDCKVPLGNTTQTTHPLSSPSCQTKRRCVTHHSECKQTEREEGATTSQTLQTHGQPHPSVPTAEMSLTETTASSHHGRRAHRQAQKKRTNHGYRSSPKTTTAPLPERHLNRPLRKTGCSAAHVTAPNTHPKRS